MKFLFALLTVLSLAQAVPADATMLVGGIQYHDVEGRIGVRVNHSGRVHRVHPSSPAEIAGIQKGDVITSVDGDRKRVVGKIHGMPGTIANLTVRRNGEELSFAVPRVEVFKIHMADKPPLLVQR
ncbi:MAG TPA: PDZ domain-containing protein [Drouetiella sp.]|jgi:C-terminal processing protease CtpA/Prc